jgi:hypothetical protein
VGGAASSWLLVFPPFLTSFLQTYYATVVPSDGSGNLRLFDLIYSFYFLLDNVLAGYHTFSPFFDAIPLPSHPASASTLLSFILTVFCSSPFLSCSRRNLSSIAAVPGKDSSNSSSAPSFHLPHQRRPAQ